MRLSTIIATLATTAIAVGAPTAAAHAQTHHSQVRIHHAVIIAHNQIGKPYVYGAEGPNAFDCSGLVQYAYGKAGYHLPRTADAQYHHARHIGHGQLRRGDMVFYHDTSGHVFHTAIFAGRSHGEKHVIEAPRPGRNVGHNVMWNAPYYAGTLRH